MRTQELIVRQTQRALEDTLRAAAALPADRLDWQPAPTSRSALNQLQEIAVSAEWFLPLLEGGQLPAFDDHARREAARLKASLDTLDACRVYARDSTARLCHAIAHFPDERLDDEISLPFGGGMMMTMADVLGLHAWNLTYHLGQINYIQTLLGDREMH